MAQRFSSMNFLKRPIIESDRLDVLPPEQRQEEEHRANPLEISPNKLSYNLVFDSEEALKRRKLIPDDEVNQMLEARDAEWQKRLKLEQIKSHRQGYDKGYADGAEKASAETRRVTEEEILGSVEGLKEALQKVETWLDELKKSIEPGITALIFSIAEQVIGVPVQQQELTQQVQNELHSIFKSMDHSLKIEIFCAQRDMNHIRKLTQEMDLQKIQIQVDPALNPGEYRIDTHNRRVIRDFKKSLYELQNKLTIECWGKSELRDRAD